MHTPTPWSRNIKPASHYPTVFAGRNEHVLVMSTSGRKPEQVEADLEFMLKAVNSHAQLVAALEEAQKELRMLNVGQNGGQKSGGSVPRALDIIKAALAAARA